MGKVKAGPAVTGHPTFGRLPADVGTAVVFVHAVHTLWEETDERKVGNRGEGRERTFQAEERQPIKHHRQMQCSWAISMRTTHTHRGVRIAVHVGSSRGETKDTVPRSRARPHSENSAVKDSRGPMEEAPLPQVRSQNPVQLRALDSFLTKAGGGGRRHLSVCTGMARAH